MFTAIDKAIVAFLGSLLYLAGLFVDLPFEVSETMLSAIAAVITPILVYAVPNKPAE